MNQLVIFDMDGVLADTEPLYRSMNRQFLLSRGYTVSDVEYDRYIGIHAHLMWSDLKPKASLPESVEQLIQMEKTAKAALLRSGDLRPVAGVLQALNAFKAAGVTMAVASSSLRSNVEIVLSRLKIGHFFAHTVTGDEVVHGKPDPEIFLKAARLCGFPADRSIVVEDSFNGITAAKRAGMFAIGYQSAASGSQDLSAADRVIGDIAELTTAMFPS